MSHGFCRYVLRTTDVDGATAFYRDLLGSRFWGEGIEVVPLPAQALIRGAPPHWVGYIGVDDATSTMSRLLQAGATQLGPSPVVTGNHAEPILRDPFGAIVALTSAGRRERDVRIAWHLLSVRDENRAFDLYAGLFGWTSIDVLDLGPEKGRHVTFTWDRSADPLGSASNIARLPHVHSQWLFFFRTERLEESLARVRTLGGLTLPAMEIANGDLVAPCDDPQGAAFALYETTVR